MRRENISIKKRFEILARDRFACQYCGRAAPQVPLVVDHCIPVAEGGSSDGFNLVTACLECNQGKSAALLTCLALRQTFWRLTEDFIASDRLKFSECPEGISFARTFIEQCFYPVKLWVEPGLHRMASILNDLVKAGLDRDLSIFHDLGFENNADTREELRLLAAFVLDVLGLSGPIIIAGSSGIDPDRHPDQVEPIAKWWIEEVLKPITQWRLSRKDLAKDLETSDH